MYNRGNYVNIKEPVDVINPSGVQSQLETGSIGIVRLYVPFSDSYVVLFIVGPKTYLCTIPAEILEQWEN